MWDWGGMECEGKLREKLVKVVGVGKLCYLLKSKIGEGSYSLVWRAEQRQTGDDVAVKQVFLSKLNPRLKACLDCEINFLSSVNHPNIIRLLHFFQVLFSFPFHFTYFPFSLLWFFLPVLFSNPFVNFYFETEYTEKIMTLFVGRVEACCFVFVWWSGWWMCVPCPRVLCRREPSFLYSKPWKSSTTNGQKIHAPAW